MKTNVSACYSRSRQRLRRTFGVFTLCASAIALSNAPASGVDLISVSIRGTPGNGASTGPAANSDGNVIVFYSDATDLVTGDTNQARDVFLRDRVHGTTERISVNSAGVQANRASQAAGGAPAANGDGQIVAFYSDATNLVDTDTNGQTDVFVRLRASGTTELTSVSTGGVQGNGPSLNPSISSDGRFVAFQSLASNLVADDTNGVADIFVRDRVNQTTERVCDGIQGNGDSSTPSISADGNFVAFASAATNLVAGDTNGHVDIFVCNRTTGVIDRVSVSTAGTQGNGDSILPAISGVGCIVAFKSIASNLVPNDNNGVVDVFARDRMAGTTERISVNPSGGDANDASFPPSISFDGRFVAFGSAASNLVVGDVNNASDVFVRDRQSGITKLVDVNDQGQQANRGTPDIPPGISGNGTQIAFASLASNLDGPDINQAYDVFATANPFSPPPEGTVCCQCGDGVPTCELPVMGACRASCTGVCNAVCQDTGECAVFTPGMTPTGGTSTPTPTGGTATPTRTGGTATPTATGGTATPTATGGTATPTSTGGTATPTSTGGTATPTSTGGTATPTATGGTATPTSTGGTATPTATGGTATPTATGGTATPTSTGGTLTPTATGGTATPTATGGTATPTPTGGTATPTRTGGTPTSTPTPRATAPLGPNDCCQCAGPACQLPSAEGTCPAACTPVRNAACQSTGDCVPFTPTQSPAPKKHFDDDSCNCSVSPGSTRRGALLWLAGAVGLLLRSRRLKRSRRYFLGFLFLATILEVPSARAQGLFGGADIGVSEPTNSNYRGHVETGASGNPFAGYMFNKYLGVQGELHFVYQPPDLHTDRGFNHPGRDTSLFGATVGPRLSIPLWELFELYGTVQGGMFTGLSGTVGHTAPGFSLGAGLNYKVTDTIAVGLFGRWNRAYMSPSPTDLGPQQLPSQQFGADIQWAVGGIGIQFTLPHAPPAPPPPPPPPVVAEAPPPTKRLIVLRAVYFDFDKYNIRPDAAPVLDEAVEIIKDEKLSVVAEGHTDGIGTVDYNLGLSRRRANSVRTYLIDHGIAADSVETKGYGKSQPVATNETAEGRALNRRVELRAK